MGLGQEAKNEKVSNENNVSPKERHVSPKKKGMNNPLRKMPSKFISPSTVSSGQEWHVV